MPETNRYVVCYDIADEKRRRRAAECLDGYGDRVQESVFEAVLEAALFDKCMSELTAIIVGREDKIAAYRLCATCDDRRRYLGIVREEDIGSEDVFVV